MSSDAAKEAASPPFTSLQYLAQTARHTPCWSSGEQMPVGYCDLGTVAHQRPFNYPPGKFESDP